LWIAPRFDASAFSADAAEREPGATYVTPELGRDNNVCLSARAIGFHPYGFLAQFNIATKGSFLFSSVAMKPDLYWVWLCWLEFSLPNGLTGA
jgi:hypothetical protein